jgi:hypothetical protein
MTLQSYSVGSVSGRRQAESTDAIYYRDGADNSLSCWAMRVARRRMFDLFRRECAVTPQTKVLDIGVSTVETPEANVLEKLYPYPHMLTCAGLSDGGEFQRQYPNLNYISIERGRRLPFDDGEFDVAYSNAVLEHVGTAQDRAFFIAEAMRISRCVFFTVPNRWFPVEHHTGICLLHYVPAVFRRVLENGPQSYWCDATNLDFLSKSALQKELSQFGRWRIAYTGLCLGPFSSNLALFIKP